MADRGVARRSKGGRKPKGKPKAPLAFCVLARDTYDVLQTQLEKLLAKKKPPAEASELLAALKALDQARKIRDGVEADDPDNPDLSDPSTRAKGARAGGRYDLAGLGGEPRGDD